VGCWRGYVSGARCRFAYSTPDTTATHCLLLREIQIGFGFWPTVLLVVPLARCVVCRLSVCDVLYCGKTIRLAKKCLKEWIGNQGQKVHFFGSPPHFYFRFRRYGHRDGRFCLIFACTAKQSVLDGRNGLSSSKPCAYFRIVRSSVSSVCLSVRVLRNSAKLNSLSFPGFPDPLISLFQTNIK